MKERKIEITERLTGKKLSAVLLICPRCEREEFVCYFPQDVDHLHFQCIFCGVSFCDGCTSHTTTDSSICQQT